MPFLYFIESIFCEKQGAAQRMMKKMITRETIRFNPTSSMFYSDLKLITGFAFAALTDRKIIRSAVMVPRIRMENRKGKMVIFIL